MELFTKKGIKILIDDEDFEKANRGRSLFVKESGLVIISKRINGIPRHIFLHKKIMQAPKGFQVDHINGDRLDNRKSNLRVCTNSENQRNKKIRSDSKNKYKGVRLYRCIKNGKTYRYFYARVCINKKTYTKHGAKSEEEAALLYNELAKKYHGEFAKLNIIQNDHASVKVT